MLSFQVKDFTQTEQNQLMSTPQEQYVDLERGRMLSIYMGFQAIKFHCFPPSPPPPHFYCFAPPPPPPPNFYRFPSNTTTTCLLFSLHHHHHHHHISIVFPPRDSIKDCPLPSLVHLVAMSRVVNNNRGFLQLIAGCPAYQRQFLLKTVTPQQLHALFQFYTI